MVEAVGGAGPWGRIRISESYPSHIRAISESYPSHIRFISESYPSHIRTHIRVPGRGRRPRVCPAAGALKRRGSPKYPLFADAAPTPQLLRKQPFSKGEFSRKRRTPRDPPLSFGNSAPETPPRKPPGLPAPLRGATAGPATGARPSRTAPGPARIKARLPARPGPVRNGMGRQRVDCARRGRAAP